MKFTSTMQPAAPPAPAPSVNQPREAASIWMSGVVAPFVQNIIGGIGVAVIAGLIGLAVAPGNPVLVSKAAAIAGAVVFGGACAIRAFRDEIAMVVAAYADGQREETTEALRRENGRLLAEVERLKDEGMVVHQWGPREAAEALVVSYFLAVAANQDVRSHLARAESMQRGLSRAQWEQGIRFLQNAGVLQRGSLTAASEEAALAAIARHAAVSKVRIRTANGDMAKL
jgi:hypothetical protein